MVLFDGGFGLIMLGLWLFCIIDVITTDQSRIRNLPKLLWLLIVLLIPDIGSICWLIAGHTWESRPAPLTKLQRDFPEYDRPGRHIPVNPDDDEAFLRQIRERAEQQRRRGEAERRAREASDD
ncbi:MAG TPA: PLDc N-terminal domain-containing protein [Micromonosporaceae bacterium]|jgi:hypothetical protein